MNTNGGTSVANTNGGTSVARGGSTNGADASKAVKAHEHTSPPTHQQIQRQPAPAHSHSSSGSAGSNKTAHHHQHHSKNQATTFATGNPVNLSTSPPHLSHNNGNNSSAQVAINNANNIAAAAATLLQQAAATFLSQSAVPAAHQNSPPSLSLSSNSATNSSFNIANIIGKTNDLPREAHGRTHPQQQKHASSPTKSSPSAVATLQSVIADSASHNQPSLFADNAVLEALAMAMAVGGFSPPAVPPLAHLGTSASPSRLPQQANPIHSPPTSPSSHLKHNHHHHHSSSHHNNNSTSTTANNTQHVNNNISHNSKKISVKTVAKKAPLPAASMQVYEFDDNNNNNKQKNAKRESKSPVVGSTSQKIAKKTPQPAVVNNNNNNNKSKQTKKPSLSNGTSSHRPSTPSKSSHLHHSSKSQNNSNNRRRKLLREQDDEEYDALENGQNDMDQGEMDEWVENAQPFITKVFLKFDWQFPSRKPDNPFTTPHTTSGGGGVEKTPASRSVSNMSTHRTASPNGSPIIMKAPKAMMKKSTKRRSK